MRTDQSIDIGRTPRGGAKSNLRLGGSPHFFEAQFGNVQRRL